MNFPPMDHQGSRHVLDSNSFFECFSTSQEHPRELRCTFISIAREATETSVNDGSQRHFHPRPLSIPLNPTDSDSWTPNPFPSWWSQVTVPCGCWGSRPEKGAPFDRQLHVSWSHHHLTFSCRLNSTTSQCVTFTTVEKTLFLVHALPEALRHPWHVPLTSCRRGRGPLESPAASPPLLPVWGPGPGSRAPDGGRGGERAGPRVNEGKREGLTWIMCLPRPICTHTPHPTPPPAYSIQMLSHLVRTLRFVQEVTLWLFPWPTASPDTCT